MKAWIGWLGRAISFTLYKSPAWVRSALAWSLTLLWFDVLRIRRKVVLQNVALAFPDWEPSQRVKVARTSLWHWALNFVEYSFLPWLKRENVDSHFEFYNLELLDKALSKGKGVLLLTLHMGNGDLGCVGLALRGYPMVMVSKFFKAKWLNDLWFGMRERAGMRFIPPRNSSYALLKGLKGGGVVVIPLDQFTGPPIGVRTTFFGVETGTAAGLAVMADRSGAPVLAAYTMRTPSGRHAVRFEREILEAQGKSHTPEQVTQIFNDELEKIVRRHPDQWMWLHRRWKRFKF